MKVNILTVLYCLCAFSVKAQSFGDLGLEIVSDTVVYNGECYIKQNHIELFTVMGNIKDEFFDVKQLMRDGTIPPAGYITRENRPIDMTVVQARVLENIVDNAFSQSQLESINDNHEVMIHININSDTGTPTGVTFTYYNNSGYENIPMEVWQSIEMQIMGEFCFTITNVGRNLNHCSIVWSQSPRGREDSGLAVPEDGEKLTMPDGKLGDAVGSLGVTCLLYTSPSPRD